MTADALEEEDHYYVAGYCVEDDPYVYPNGVLINHFELQDTQSLNVIEAELSALGVAELMKADIPQAFDTQTLQDIHHVIFGNVYPWAGEFRKVDIAKRDTQFLPNGDIQAALDELFAQAKQAQFFTDLPKEDFAQKAAEFLLRLNQIHPFREGNGRTQRTLISWMATNAGFDMKWDGISNTAMCDACIEGELGSSAKMRKIFMIYLEPLPDQPKLHTHTALAQGLRKLLGQLEAQLDLREPIDAYIGGEMAAHLYIAEGVADKVDVEFAQRVCLSGDLVVHIAPEDGAGQSLRLDAGPNPMLTLAHDNRRADAVPVDLGCMHIRTHVLSPVDLVVNKINRPSERDKEDIAALVRLGLVNAHSIAQRATEASAQYISDTAALKSNIQDVVAVAQEAENARDTIKPRPSIKRP